MDTIFSLIGGAYRLVIDVPVFGIGIAVGAYGMWILLKKNPALLQKLVTLVQAEAAKLESSATAATTTATAAAPTSTAAGTTASTPAKD